MKIFIGITACNRPDNLTEAIDALRKHTKMPFELVVACDSPESLDYCREKGYPALGGTRRGIAYSKNRLISYAESVGYDYLFLFDDDTFPIKDGWESWIIDGMEKFAIGHWLFLPSFHYGKIIRTDERDGYVMKESEYDGGCLMVLTRSTVAKVGGMHPAFYANPYGGEHSDYARRIERARVSPWAKLSFVGAEEWLDGHDWRVVSGREQMGPPLSPEARAVLDQQIQRGLQIYQNVMYDGVHQPFTVDEVDRVAYRH